MKITPLVLHGGLILPRHTALFSEALAVTSLVVNEGGNVVLTTTTPHGFPNGTQIAISITDAITPNPITAAVVNADGDIELTTQYPHTITTTPNANLFDQYSTLATLVGFSSASINGNRQIVDAPTRYKVVITPGATVGSVTLNGNEALHEHLELEIIGWHNVVATGASTLAFPTPAGVNRTYTAINPVVVTNIRIFGTFDYDTAMGQYTADNNSVTLTRPVMFVLPQPVDRRGGAIYATDGSDNRIHVNDGFTVLVLIPSHETSGHVASIDMAHGSIFRAVMRTFHGLRISRSEFSAPGNYRAVFERHNGARGTGKNRAIYAHEYVFSMPADIGDCDAVSPFEWGQIDDGAIADGDVPDSIYASDPVPFRDLAISGILHHGHPTPLTGTFTIETEEA